MLVIYRGVNTAMRHKKQRHIYQKKLEIIVQKRA